MTLNIKVYMNEVQKCIPFLIDKGTEIDDIKCCDQVSNLNKLLEQNIHGLDNLCSNDK